MSSTSSTNPDQPTNDPVAAAADAALVPMSAAGEVMTVLVVVLFLLFVIALVLYLRTKHCPGTLGYSRRARRGPLPFAPGSASPLEPSVLGSLPVTSVRLRGFVEPESGLDQCAVCLSEFGEGEKARLLPKCGHGFHVDCIDMWFASNSTCPLCRLPVVDVPRACRDASSGSSDEGSSSTARCSPPEKREKGIVLVIDIPERSSPLAPLAGLEGQIGVGGVEKRDN